MSLNDILVQVVKYVGFGVAAAGVLAAEHYWNFDLSTGNLILGYIATMLGIKVLTGVLPLPTSTTTTTPPATSLSVPPVLVDAVHTNTDALALNTQVTSQNTVAMLNQGKQGTPSS